MGMALTEKILSKACGRSVMPGEIVNVNVDKLMIVDMSGPIAFNLFEKIGTSKLYNSDMIVLVADHYGSGHDLKSANLIKKFRDYGNQYAIKEFFDQGRHGICHQVMAENGLVLPNTVTVGTDSHATTYGALGAFGCGVSTSEAAVIMAIGKIWFRVPSSIKIELTGKLPFGCYGKDVALKIVSLLGCDETALYKAVEITGEGVKSLDMDDRLALCNMIAETGAKNCIIPADEVTASYLGNKSSELYEIMESDQDAQYDLIYNINLDELVPYVAVPHMTSDVHPAAELEGTEINQAFLGSCTSGRLSEIAIAVKIFKGRKLPDKMVMRIVPSSQKIFLEAVKLGYIEILMEAGITVESSSCACCGGLHTGVLPDGAICISTTNRNFRGRMGSPDSFVYLASAATVAASALEGRIVDPRKYLLRR
jgi:3-isopropylmalate/(R)-2-methylmalate dehydratase large subunit